MITSFLSPEHDNLLAEVMVVGINFCVKLLLYKSPNFAGRGIVLCTLSRRGISCFLALKNSV